MLRKRITLCIASSLLMLLSSVSSVFAAIPPNSVIIGNKAYDISLLFDANYLSAINNALANSNGVMYYNMGGNTFYNIMTGSPVTSTELSQLPAVTFTDAQQNQTVYAAGNGAGAPVALSNAAVTVLSGSISSFKQITVNSTNVTGAQKFSVTDLSTSTTSAVVAIGATVTVMTSASSLKLEVLDASDGVLASGTLVVSADGNLTVQLTNTTTPVTTGDFEVLSIE